MQHRELGGAQFPCMRIEHNSSKRIHKGLRQWAKDQDMAGRDGVRLQHFL